MPAVAHTRYVPDTKSARRAQRGDGPAALPNGNSFDLPHEGAAMSARAMRRAAAKAERAHKRSMEAGAVLTRAADPGVLTRRAPSGLALRPSTINEAERTVIATLATGAGVNRGAYIERLSLGPSNLELPRSLPLLDNHNGASVQHVIGSVDQIRRETDAQGRHTIVGRLRLADDHAWALVRDGHLSGVSVGYAVTTWADSTEGGQRVRTAGRLSLREVSLVIAPADDGARIRSTPQESTMPDTNPAPENVAPDTTTTTATRAAPAQPAGTQGTTAAQPGEVQTRAAVNARIRSLGRAAGLPGDFIDAQIDGEATEDSFRSAAFDHMTRAAGPAIRVQVGASHDAPEVIHARQVEALAHRHAPDLCALSDAARPYAGMTLAGMARDALAREGVRGLGAMSDEAVLTRAQDTVSDFPGLLDGAGERILRASFEAAASPVRTALARQRLARDFRALALLRLDGPGTLQRVTESGEIKAVTAGETKEGFALETFAGMFNLSRKALINDDLGAFADWQRMMGRASAETEAAAIVNLLLAGNGAGAKLSDGKALFHADHGNLLTSAELSVAALTDARTALRRQRNPNGSPSNVVPRFLLVAPEQETLAEQVVAALTAAAVGEVNPFGGKLTALVEPRLPEGAWYLFAAPEAAPVIEYAYLSSAPGPQLASRDGWDVLGRSFRVVLDFGCGVTDFRGAQRNPGDAI
ncbi:prohead protease/major capsid protein fusion protein [Pararoseomonas sp. SCSIO 73927]|uniref:prohead protease/major capsid protein fusion protein n=1 Tax=Pararoseomonas sp. SCSIO 73927 TaxID=3114537 RepID=UPI0030D35C9B